MSDFSDAAYRNTFRHTSSHILAHAVKRLYPETKLAIGPAIENGFYYDFDRDTPFTTDDLKNIEDEMQKIVKEHLMVERFELPRTEARQLMAEKGEIYKVELIDELPPEATISFYRQGDFVDLCAGPHLANTAEVKAFKLTQLAG
ncbi:MAG TPA: threonine--tRNA ligase, partial [Clostridiales bacterium]|nr:threonine--tRNA ligase [Clostridiales bacterium]